MLASFIVPAYNEERNIGRCLYNLTGLDSIEILVGVTGTDSTLSIVKECAELHKNVSAFFYGKERTGKPFVINNLIKEAKGDVIVIHDADWEVRGSTALGFSALLEKFEDERVGGIAVSFSPAFNRDILNSGNLALIANAWFSKIVIDYAREKFTYREGGKRFVKEDGRFPFTLNILRKSLASDAVSVADDVERLFNIFRQGYRVLVLDSRDIPQQYHIVEDVTFGKIYTLKYRGAIARKQLEGAGYSVSIPFLSLAARIITNLPRMKVTHGLALVYYVLLTGTATLHARLKREQIDAKDAWGMRLR